jgi:hypothetical protein
MSADGLDLGRGDDAEARAWARAARQRAEAGLVRDDSEFLERKLTQERQRLTSRSRAEQQPRVT